jgi:hypothetical protein
VTIGLQDSVARLRNPQGGVVTIEIAPAPVERTVEGVAVGLRGLAAGRSATLRPAHVTATVRGAATALNGLTPDRLECYADLSGLLPGRYNLPVRFQSSGGVAITRVEPANLDVTIR